MPNKSCTQLSLSQILFQNPKNYSFEDVHRFCYHSWCDSTVIFDKISNSSNIYLSSNRFWTATSLVIVYQIPSFSKLRISPKIIWSVQSLIPINLLHQYQCFCRRQTDLETKFFGNSLFISPSMTCKENWLYKTSYNSYTVEDKRNCVWSNVGW